MSAIRPVTSADTPHVQRLVGCVFAEYGFKLDLDGLDAHLKAPGPYFRHRGGEFWVVENAGRIVATVAVELHADAGELRCLYVHPDHRRQGWGRRLTRMTMEYARQTGKRRFFLWTDTRFSAAHALYRAMGFAQHGERSLNDPYDTREYGFSIDLDYSR